MNESWGDLEASVGGGQRQLWRLASATSWRHRAVITLLRYPSDGYLAHGIQIYEARVTARRGGKIELGGSEGDGGIQYAAATGCAPAV